jgi:hypothetical protein
MDDASLPTDRITERVTVTALPDAAMHQVFLSGLAEGDEMDPEDAWPGIPATLSVIPTPEGCILELSGEAAVGSEIGMMARVRMRRALERIGYQLEHPDTVVLPETGLIQSLPA